MPVEKLRAFSFIQFSVEQLFRYHLKKFYRVHLRAQFLSQIKLWLFGGIKRREVFIREHYTLLQ
jgi:hypothetical protein